MRLRSLTHITLWLATHCLHVFAAPVIVASVNIGGWQGCSTAQQNAIYDAYEDAMKMAELVKGDIDWHEAAAIDFLGPERLNKAGQDNIKSEQLELSIVYSLANELLEVLNNAATFGQGWKITPTPFKFRINVRCDDWQVDPEVRSPLRSESGSMTKVQ